MPQHPLEIALAKAEARLAEAPDDAERLFERAALLDGLGDPAARDAYIAVLARDDAHVAALANLGALLLKTGYRSAARTVYAQAVEQHPRAPAAHVNLANLLAAAEEPEAAERHFRAALALDPAFPEAHKGLAELLSARGDAAGARPHREAAFADRPVLVLPYRGSGRPVRVLVLASTLGAGVPIARHLDDRVFHTSVAYVEAFDPTRPLPPHDLVFNAIGDADLCGPALGLAERLLASALPAKVGPVWRRGSAPAKKRRSLSRFMRTSSGALPAKVGPVWRRGSAPAKKSSWIRAPVINPPARVVPTGRAENARRLGALPGVVTPRMVRLPRERLTAEALAALGFGFPLLLRAPGFHTGRFFEKVDGPEHLAEAAARIPGDDLTAIEFLDARSADGKIRKYRAMMIGGALLPVHAAVSGQWKIHYFSAEMADHPQHRAEDEAFLADMAGVLGPRAMAALEAVRDALGLDYAGADFSLSPQGELILFEANATMVINPPDADPRWDYRRPYVQTVLDAIQRLLRAEPQS